jgi:hypothetical protein
MRWRKHISDAMSVRTYKTANDLDAAIYDDIL